MSKERKQRLNNIEKSPSTRRAYCSDFDAFRKWRSARNLNALPASPATFATFLASAYSKRIGLGQLAIPQHGDPEQCAEAYFQTPTPELTKKYVSVYTRYGPSRLRTYGTASLR